MQGVSFDCPSAAFRVPNPFAGLVQILILLCQNDQAQSRQQLPRRRCLLVSPMKPSPIPPFRHKAGAACLRLSELIPAMYSLPLSFISQPLLNLDGGLGQMAAILVCVDRAGQGEASDMGFIGIG